MGLTREQIVNREIEYFKSDLAIDPAFVANYDDGEGKCVYKTEDGRKCAVGVLIKPALYEEKFDDREGTAARALPPNVLDYLGRDNIEWLGELQHCHDDCARNWDLELRDAAHNHFGKFFLDAARNLKLLNV